jgi:hypothetical protein
MKIAISPRKPRNPMVAPAQFRRAGAHRAHGNAARQQAARTLRREIDQFTRHKTHTP